MDKKREISFFELACYIFSGGDTLGSDLDKYKYTTIDFDFLSDEEDEKMETIIKKILKKNLSSDKVAKVTEDITGNLGAHDHISELIGFCKGMKVGSKLIIDLLFKANLNLQN